MASKSKSFHRPTKPIWQRPKLKLTNLSHECPYSPSGSTPETPSSTNGKFFGFINFDDMDQEHLNKSFSLYDCGNFEAGSLEDSMEDDVFMMDEQCSTRKKKAGPSKQHLYIVNSPSPKKMAFLPPPKSILVQPAQQYTAISSEQLKRPKPIPKLHRGRATSDTVPIVNASEKNWLNTEKQRARSKTICAQKETRNKNNPVETRRQRFDSTEMESNNLCAYCKSIGMDYQGHTKQKCPRIEILEPCKLCGAAGYDNHTMTHCPSSMKVTLRLDPAFSARLAIAQRARNIAF